MVDKWKQIPKCNLIAASAVHDFSLSSFPIALPGWFAQTRKNPTTALADRWVRGEAHPPQDF